MLGVITPRSNANPAQCEALAMGHLGAPKAESLGACERALRVERKDMGTSGLVRDSRVHSPGVRFPLAKLLNHRGRCACFKSSGGVPTSR